MHDSKITILEGEQHSTTRKAKKPTHFERNATCTTLIIPARDETFVMSLSMCGG